VGGHALVPVIFLDWLKKAVVRKNLPLYFDPTVNMLAGRTSYEREVLRAAIESVQKRILYTTLALVVSTKPYMLGPPTPQRPPYELPVAEHQQMLASCFEVASEDTPESAATPSGGFFGNAELTAFGDLSASVIELGCHSRPREGGQTCATRP